MPCKYPGTLTGSRGFTLLELLLALALTVTLAAAVLPVWTGLLEYQTAASDHVIDLAQGRVAGARLVRDLRLASAADMAQAGGVALLRAEEEELVLLSQVGVEGGLELVEWELDGSRLVRRRSPWSGPLPDSIGHGAFIDHKTMLEGVSGDARFAYMAGGIRLLTPVIEPKERRLIDTVSLMGHIESAVGNGVPRAPLLAKGELGQ